MYATIFLGLAFLTRISLSNEAYCRTSSGGAFVNQCVKDMFAADPNQNICGPCGCSGCPLVRPPTPTPTTAHPTQPPTFTASGLRCGTSACATYYNNISGTRVQHLKTASKFPESPDAHVPLDRLEMSGVKADCMAEAANAQEGAATRHDFETGCDFASKVSKDMCLESCAAFTGAPLGCCKCNGECNQCGCAYCTIFCEKYAGKDDNYGVLLEAWVKAPTTGDYVFSTQSDDSSEVWVSTTPGVVQTDAEMTKVVELDGCCTKVTGTTTVSLEGGKSYFLRGYMKEGAGRDYFTVGMTVNGREYWPLQESKFDVESTLGYVDPSAPAPVCENTGSQFTEAMLGKMDTAQQKFGECADDIAEIAGTLGKLSTASMVVKKIMEATDKIVERVEDVFDSMMKAKIADILGKIPKVGILIKMGIKAMDKVMDALEPLFDMMAKQAARIDSAVYITSNTFKAMRLVATPTWLYLSGSHNVLKAAHECAQATGYECGSAGARLEAKNKDKYPSSSDELEKIADAGAACHAVLNPMEQVMKAIAYMAEQMVKLLEPIMQILQAVEDWVTEMEREIKKFVEALSDSPGAQCALEIFEPVTDTINLLTCPVDELVGAFMHYVVNNLILKAGVAIQTATNNGITAAVDAFIPDSFELYIPDFTNIVPHDAWYGFCEDAALVFPTLPNTIKDFVNLDLPYRVTGKDLEDKILSKALSKTDLGYELGEYESACVEAWNEMGTDFENCQKVLDEIEEAARFAACETAKFAHDANEETVDAALSASNAARKHFNDAKSDFQAAQSHLTEVQKDLNGAINSLQNAKNDCPNCRCGGCGWDFGCIAESAWCCPARHACLGALDVASGSVHVAKGSVSVAEASVSLAANTYVHAERGLRHAESELNYYKALAAESAKSVDDICGRRRLEILGLQNAPLAKRLGAVSLMQDEE